MNTVEIEKKQGKMDPITCKKIPSKASGGLHRMVIQMDFERRNDDDKRILLGSSSFENHFLQTHEMKLYDQSGKLSFQLMGNATDESMVCLLQEAVSHLRRGMEVLEITFSHSSPDKEIVIFDHHYDHRYINTILLEAFQVDNQLEELKIYGGNSSLDSVFTFIDQIVFTGETTSINNNNNHNAPCCFRRLALDHQMTMHEVMVETELGKQSINVLSRWISAEGGLEELEMNGFISSESKATMCHAISNSTSIRHLQIESDLLEILADNNFAQAIRKNQSLTRFTTEHFVVEDPSQVEFLKALSEQPNLIKYFDITWSEPSFEGFDTAIVPMLETNSWVGGLVFLFAMDALIFQTLEMKSFFQALGRNSSINSLEFHGFMTFSPEAAGHLWKAVKENESLEKLIFNDWGWNGSPSIKLPKGWEHDFVCSVLPNLSVLELELMTMNLSIEDTFRFWKTLAFDKQLRIKKISIENLKSEWNEWEKAFCATILPNLSIRELYLPNFKPRAVGWNVLLEALSQNRQLEILETGYFPSPKGQGENKPIDTYEAQSFRHVQQLLRLNRAGRWMEDCKKAVATNPNLSPVVLERINNLNFIEDSSSTASSPSEKEKAFTADMMYHFLQGPYLNPILVLNHNYCSSNNR